MKLLPNIHLPDSIKQYTNNKVYADIEAVGLYDKVNTLADIHVLACIVDCPNGSPNGDVPASGSTNVLESKTLLFHNHPELDNTTVRDNYDGKDYFIPERVGTLEQGVLFFYEVGRSEKGVLSIHNAFSYDIPVLEKVCPDFHIPDTKVEDTFILSKLQYFDRKTPRGCSGAHGLAAYAIRSGNFKPSITDFTKMDALMLHRVIEDVKAQKYASNYLSHERELLYKKNAINFIPAYRREVAYVKSCFRQEIFGAKVDVPHMNHCVEMWDNRLNELESIIEPQLPATVKASGEKINRQDMARCMGIDEALVRKMHVPKEKVKRNGEEVLVDVKPYYKPVTKLTTSKKEVCYQGFHLSKGFSPSFVKKKDLTDWIKESHSDTISKEWNIDKEETVVEKPTSQLCKYFDLDEEAVAAIVGGAFTKVSFSASKLTQHEVVKSLLIKGGIKTAAEWNLKRDSDNNIMRAEEDLVVRYPAKAHPSAQMVYKVKKGQPIVTTPKFGEKEYEQLSSDIGKQIAEYNTTIHRRRFLSNPKDPDNKGILAAVREDGRIPCGVNTFNTSTGRSSHRVWVNAPSASALYGKEIRQCVVAEKGYKLIGADQKSAQLSLAAYYTNNESYYNAICYGSENKLDSEGEEIIDSNTGKPIYLGESGHCVNARAFGLVTKEEFERAVLTQDETLLKHISLQRKRSKGATFGTLFGCSGNKLATMLNISPEEGVAKRNQFLVTIGLDRLSELLETMMACNNRSGSTGYIELPFGYYAACSSSHKAINFLIQGSEAAVEKYAELYFDRELKKQRLKARRIISYHDEMLCECPDEEVEVVRLLMNTAFEEASLALRRWHASNSKWFTKEYLPSFNINLAAGTKVGENYYDVH